MAAPLLKCLLVLSALDSVGATSAVLGGVVGDDDSGYPFRALLESSPTCSSSCSAEHASTNSAFTSDFDASLEVQLQAIREFVGMTPPSSHARAVAPALASPLGGHTGRCHARAA